MATLARASPGSQQRYSWIVRSSSPGGSGDNAGIRSDRVELLGTGLVVLHVVTGTVAYTVVPEYAYYRSITVVYRTGARLA